MKYLSLILAALLPLTLSAQTKLSDLIEGTTIVATDLIPFVDVSDTTQAASGSTKKAQAGVLASQLAQLIAPTWNNAGTDFTALKVNVTNTASGAGSKLLDLIVDGTSILQVTKDGVIRPDTITYSPNLDFSPHGVTISRPDSGNIVRFSTYGGQFGVKLSCDSFLGWHEVGGLDSPPDLKLYRQAANILAQRNGTNAQEFRLYNTYDGTNDEWGFLKWDSNVLKIGAAASGTGTVRTLELTPATIILASLPTSSAGLPSGALWRDTSTDTVRIVP